MTIPGIGDPVPGSAGIAPGPISTAPYISERFFEIEKAIWRDSWLALGRSGDLRAFHNVCPHRGARSFACRFHDWAFDLEGQLRALPEPRLFPELERADRPRLRPIAVDTWGGFVFVNLDPAPTETLAEYLRGLPPTLDAYLRDQPWTSSTGVATPRPCTRGPSARGSRSRIAATTSIRTAPALVRC